MQIIEKNWAKDSLVDCQSRQNRNGQVQATLAECRLRSSNLRQCVDFQVQATAFMVKTEAYMNLTTDQITEIIYDRFSLAPADISWNWAGGLLVGVGLIAGGIFVTIVTGGVGTPALLASIAIATGMSGVMYTTTSLIKGGGQSFEWQMFATESLVGGATAAATMGLAQGVVYAKGLKSIADLSILAMASCSAASSASVQMARNAAECNGILDGVAVATIGAFVGSYVGGAVGFKYNPGSALPTNIQLAKGFVAGIAAGAVAGGASSIASNSAINVVMGRDIFENITDAFKSGVISGAIGGSANMVIVTAGRLQTRAYHSSQIMTAANTTKYHGPSGGIQLELWAEANNQRVLVINSEDGHVCSYGHANKGLPPILLKFEPGVNGPGHYTRLNNITQKPEIGPCSGRFTCMADSLGVTPESLSKGVTIRNARRANLSHIELDLLYNKDVGGVLVGNIDWNNGNGGVADVPVVPDPGVNAPRKEQKAYRKYLHKVREVNDRRELFRSSLVRLFNDADQVFQDNITNCPPAVDVTAHYGTFHTSAADSNIHVTGKVDFNSGKGTIHGYELTNPSSGEIYSSNNSVLYR